MHYEENMQIIKNCLFYHN